MQSNRFLRNHHPVPHLEEHEFKLTIHGKGLALHATLLVMAISCKGQSIELMGDVNRTGSCATITRSRT